MKPTACLFTALLLTACGTSQEPDYSTLLAVSGTATPSITTTLRIDRPILPGYLDRPEMVGETADGHLLIDEYERWGESLDTMFERVLAEDVQQRLPQSFVTTDEDEQAAKACEKIDSHIDRFNRTAEGYSLKAQLAVSMTCGCNAGQTSTTSVEATISDKTAVAGLSALIGVYADHVLGLMQPQACGAR